jgi:hypothetical protein
MDPTVLSLLAPLFLSSLWLMYACRILHMIFDLCMHVELERQNLFWNTWHHDSCSFYYNRIELRSSNPLIERFLQTWQIKWETHLSVEIGPEGGRRHNSPLTVPPSSEGDTAEGPLGDERNARLLLLPLLSKLLYITTKLLLPLLLQLSPYAMKETKHSEPKALGSNRSLRSSLLINVCPFNYKRTSVYRRPWGCSNTPITPFSFLTNDFTRFWRV